MAVDVPLFLLLNYGFRMVYCVMRFFILKIKSLALYSTGRSRRGHLGCQAPQKICLHAMAVNELRIQNGLLRNSCEGRRSPGLMDASELLFQNGLLRDVIF